MTYAHDAHCNTIHEAGPEPCPPPREDNERSVFGGISSVSLLKPGDRVLVDVGEHHTMADVDRMISAVKERFPDIEFTFISGVRAVIVAPARRSEVPVDH